MSASQLLCWIILGFTAVLVPGEAHAYLDPGTGSIILQVIAAGVLGALFTIKTYYREFKVFLSRVFRRRSDDGTDK